jgi:Outer membrane protein Omp28
MKKIISILSLAFIVGSCCKEQIPAGLQLTGGGKQVGDTTYILPAIPAAQLKNVLVEEFTGVRCANCPVAAAALKNIQLATPNRIFAAKFHTGGLAIPVINTDPDFRCDQADDIDNALGGAAPGQPAAVINRILNLSTGKFSNAYSSGKWPLMISQELVEPTIVNLKLEKNVTGQDIQAVCSFTFTDTTSEPLSYCLYLTESKVEAEQDSVYLSGGFPVVVPIMYDHEEIFRFTPTPEFIGANLPAVLQEKGRHYVRVLNFTKPSKVINLANCHLILFVQNSMTKKVLQTVEIPL